MFPGSWLPDGRSITFNTNDPLNSNPTIAAGGGSFDIGRVTLGDTAVTWLVKTQFSEAHPQVAPDGRLLAYISDRSGRREVYVQPLSGSGVPAQVSSEGATSPRWSRDSRTVFYVSAANSIIGATIGPGAGIAIVKRTEIASRLGLDLNPPNVNWDLFPDDKPLVIDGSGGQGKRRMALVQNWPAIARALGDGAKR